MQLTNLSLAISNPGTVIAVVEVTDDLGAPASLTVAFDLTAVNDRGRPVTISGAVGRSAKDTGLASGVFSVPANWGLQSPEGKVLLVAAKITTPRLVPIDGAFRVQDGVATQV